MNTKQNTTRTTIIFVSLALAGIGISVISQIVPNDFAQTLMLTIGCTIFGSGLTFFLIQMSTHIYK